MLTRAIAIARLDVSTFEEVEHERSLTREAAIIVLIASIIGSIGGPPTGMRPFIANVLINVVGWFVWSAIVAFVAQKMFNATTDRGEMLRTIGYAYGPRVLGLIPFLGFIGAVWSVVAVIVGIRQAGDFSTSKAVITALVGFIPYLISMGIIVAIFS